MQNKAIGILLTLLILGGLLYSFSASADTPVVTPSVHPAKISSYDEASPDEATPDEPYPAIKPAKKANTMEVTVKGNISINLDKISEEGLSIPAITVRLAKGYVNYTIIEGDTTLFSVNNGRIVISKNTSAGEYTIEVKVTAAGNSIYLAKSAISTININVIGNNSTKPTETAQPIVAPKATTPAKQTTSTATNTAKPAAKPNATVKSTAKAKSANTITVKASKKTVKAKKLKKKAQKIHALTVTNAQGKITYKKLSGSKKLSVSKKGVITVKKGKYKKGKTLTIKVRITASGNKSFSPKYIDKTVKIKIS